MMTEQSYKVHLSARDFKRLRDLREERPARNIPKPFMTVGAALSFQAAYAAPIIMMSQNRQSEIDRRRAQHDCRINVKAELEIEFLHNKIDALREQETVQLLNIIQRLSAHLAPELVAANETEAAPHRRA